VSALTATRGPLGLPRELTDPPPGLAPESFAATLYTDLAPLARQDADYGWALLILCNAVGQMFQLLDDVERDSAEGPGWSPLLDLDRCPDEALPWLAQFAGVRLLPDSTPSEQRARIEATDGWKRGTPAALVGAAQATLTGSRQVILRERDTDPYHLTIRTLTGQTPSATSTLNAILAQKPGGLTLDFAAVAGQDYAGLKTKKANYAAVKSGYVDYAAVRADF
jgi:hypothetical protein